MSQMPKNLELNDYDSARTLDDIKRIGNENNRLLQAAYAQIFNDVNYKEWLYFTVNKKRWRIGPDPDGNDFLIQELTGLNWRNQSHWTTQQTAYGGPKATS